MVYTYTLAIKLPDDLREELKKKATEKGISVAELVRRLIVDYVYNSSEEIVD
jgi:predicted DNA-binding protein